MVLQRQVKGGCVLKRRLYLVREVVWCVMEGMLTFDIRVDIDNHLCRLQDRI